MFFIFLLLYSCTALRIAVIGDAGKVTKPQVENFKSILKENVDTFFAVGDNFYDKGARNNTVVYQFGKVWGKLMQKKYAYKPLFINGNHDHLGDPKALTVFRNIHFPNLQYTKKIGNILEVISIDSTVLFGNWFWNKHKLSDQDQKKFLKQALKNDKTTVWRMVLFHHNVMSVTKHFQEKFKEKKKLIQLFDKHKVDFVVGGHSHCFEYCKSNYTNYFVIGAGSKIDRGIHGTNAKCTKHLFENGYGIFELSETDAKFEYKSRTGFKKQFLAL